MKTTTLDKNPEENLGTFKIYEVCIRKAKKTI